jgi:hypothetical protein
MPPCMAAHDPAEFPRSQSELSSEHVSEFTRRKAGAYFDDLRLGKFRVAVSFSFHPTSATAPLSTHIAHVLGSGAKEEVIWPDAQRIVAMVADVIAVRNWAMRQ